MVNLRRVELSDLPQLREIVSTAFKHHRFWVDNKLDQDKVKEFYIKSIDKMVKDFFENSDKRDFIVAVEDEKIVGYITSLIDDERTSIFGADGE